MITAENLDSREVAENVWTSEETKTAMEADGIDMSTVIVEHVEEAFWIGSGPDRIAVTAAPGEWMSLLL